METSAPKPKSTAINIPKRYTTDSPKNTTDSPNTQMSISPISKSLDDKPYYKSPIERTKINVWNLFHTPTLDVPQQNDTFHINYPRLGSIEHTKKNSPDANIPAQNKISNKYQNKDNFRPYDAMARSKGSGI